MRLKELKRMIAEEYSRYLKEQEDVAVDVQPDVDVDAMGPMGDEMPEEDPETTLRTIYDMLKAYFEGEEEVGDLGAPEDVEGGMPPAPPAPPAADLEEWRGKNDKTVTRGSKSSSGPNAGYKKEATTRGHTGFGDAKKESLQEVKRMQKLANIIK